MNAAKAAGWLIAAWVALSGCGPAEGSVPNGGSCTRDRHCESRNCDFDTGGPGVCIARCIANGNACGPSGRPVAACCSGFCGDTGTCR